MDILKDILTLATLVLLIQLVVVMIRDYTRQWNRSGRSRAQSNESACTHNWVWTSLKRANTRWVERCNLCWAIRRDSAGTTDERERVQ